MSPRPRATSTRVEKAGDLEDALRKASAHDGPALVEVAAARQELSLPPKLAYAEIKGFSLYAARTILSGGGEELLDLPEPACETSTSSKRGSSESAM